MRDEVDPSEWNGKLPEGWEKMVLPFHKTLPRVNDLKVTGIEDDLIEGLLPRGITIIAGASGVGKSWFSQSITKALISGEAFAGKFVVPERTPVIYLQPEISAQSFLTRCEKLGLKQYEGFLIVRTMDNELKGLDDEDLQAAVRALRPVVFLDTLIRFGSADENSASANAVLFDRISSLRNLGAKAVVGIHHSPKNTASGAKAMTLENGLRGSGDLGAMLDFCIGLQATSEQGCDLRVLNLKNRNGAPFSTFILKSNPVEEDNFYFTTDAAPPTRKSRSKHLNEQLNKNPNLTYRELFEITKIPVASIKRVAAKAGWKHDGLKFSRSHIS